MMEDTSSLPLLHHCHVHKLQAYLNRTYTILHLLALLAIFYYRGAFFLNRNDPKYHNIPFLPWLILFLAEFVLSFAWLLRQAYYYRPVSRTVFPERLPEDDNLPAIDVFICTADPLREPTLKVMNTVISAMTLDCPADRLNVYLSDDAGAPVTFVGMQYAWSFATWWLPFCKKYGVKTICPQAYFNEPEESTQDRNFIEDRKMVQEKYKLFKQKLQLRSEEAMIGAVDGKTTSPQDHPAIIQVINESSIENDASNFRKEHVKMPPLVYMAREKRPSYPHHFKGGALNALLRVSGILSNSQYILVLDCDMYCNDPISARQAMCLFSDPKVSPSLGWVQYPQKFHNVSESDICDSQMRMFWPVYWPGIDGLQGPVISGTNFYIKREILYGTQCLEGSELRASFGTSYDFIKSLNHQHNSSEQRTERCEFLEEAQTVASCTYEEGTNWGSQVGFQHDTVMEDVMTGIFLQSKGWKSAYLNPGRPQFLGTATTNLTELLTQNIRHYSGLLDIGLSKNCPLFHGSDSKMQVLQKMATSWAAFMPIDCFPILCLAAVSPLCFLYGIPVYPKVSDPYFLAFAYVFISSRLKLLCDILLICGGSVRSWLVEERSWMIKAITSQFYGTVACFMKKGGIRDLNFTPTNKAGLDDLTSYYQIGIYDFRISDMFLIPLVTVVTLNLSCFVCGVAGVILEGRWESMLAQVIFSTYVLLMSFPVLEAMLLRTDSGCIPLSSTLKSALVSLLSWSLGYLILFR